MLYRCARYVYYVCSFLKRCNSFQNLFIGLSTFPPRIPPKKHGDEIILGDMLRPPFHIVLEGLHLIENNQELAQGLRDVGCVHWDLLQDVVRVDQLFVVNKGKDDMYGLGGMDFGFDQSR
jgi:hypothetical protein